MKVLIVGSGAREHALAWKLAQSHHRPTVIVSPGNAGIEVTQSGQESPLVRMTLAAEDIEGLHTFAREEQVDLTIVGPEVPLVAGLTDHFRATGLRVFGPSSAGAQLEGSKAFAKELMLRAKIPTARFRVFDDAVAARAYVTQHGAPVVVKVNGLAAGKGVVVAQTLHDAFVAIDEAMEHRVFGAAGDTVVVEDYLEGDELSVMALVSDGVCQLLPPSQDHKTLLDGDHGPNTGGMGAFTPVPWVDQPLLDTMRIQVFEPLMHELEREGISYRGVIYAGVMVTSDGPRVLEFNVRFGDPETQVTLPQLDCDLVDLCLAVADGTLGRLAVSVQPGAAAGIVMTARGYPGHYEVGHFITGLTKWPEDNLVFSSGLAKVNGHIVTAGGRVLTVVGLGADLKSALDRAYAGVKNIHFEGMHFRKDIGYRPRRLGESW